MSASSVDYTMKSASPELEFEVSFVQTDGLEVIVSGRNYEANVYIGDVFKWVYRRTTHKTSEHEYYFTCSDERAVMLQVKRLEFARRDTDVLGQGSTGRIWLTGVGSDLVKPYGENPTSIDLLRGNRFSPSQQERCRLTAARQNTVLSERTAPTP